MLNKNDFLEKLIDECLDDLYRASFPSITLEELKNSVTDKNERMYEHHYLPKERQDEIVQYYINEFLPNHFVDNAEFVKDSLINGFYERTYDKDGRKYVHTQKLRNLLNDENDAGIVEKLLDKIISEHNRNHDAEAFQFTVFNYAPTINKNTVIEYWKSKGVDYKEEDFDDSKFHSIWEDESDFEE